MRMPYYGVFLEGSFLKKLPENKQVIFKRQKNLLNQIQIVVDITFSK